MKLLPTGSVCALAPRRLTFICSASKKGTSSCLTKHHGPWEILQALSLWKSSQVCGWRMWLLTWFKGILASGKIQTDLVWMIWACLCLNQFTHKQFWSPLEVRFKNCGGIADPQRSWADWKERDIYKKEKINSSQQRPMALLDIIMLENSYSKGLWLIIHMELGFDQHWYYLSLPSLFRLCLPLQQGWQDLNLLYIYSK